MANASDVFKNRASLMALGKESACNAGDENLVGYSPWGPKELDMTEYKRISLRTSSPKESVFSQVIVVIAVQLLSHVQFCDTMGSATSFPFAFNLGQHQGLFQ